MSSNKAIQAALKFGPECVEEVTRAGRLEPCEKPGAAVRLDPNEGLPYVVCAKHARSEMVPLDKVVAAVRAETVAAVLAEQAKVTEVVVHREDGFNSYPITALSWSNALAAARLVAGSDPFAEGGAR